MRWNRGRGGEKLYNRTDKPLIDYAYRTIVNNAQNQIGVVYSQLAAAFRILKFYFTFDQPLFTLYFASCLVILKLGYFKFLLA